MRVKAILLSSCATLLLACSEPTPSNATSSDEQGGAPIKFVDKAVEAGIASPGTNSAGVAFGDYDNDGDIDLYINVEDAAPGLHNKLWRNNGDGTFTDVAEESGAQNAGGLGRGVSWGDMDNDGDLDLLVATMPPSGPGRRAAVPTTVYKSLLIETGEPKFENITTAAGVIRSDDEEDLQIGGMLQTSGGIEWVDYNNDSLLDIMWRSADHDADQELFKNNGDGTFKRVTKEAGVSLLGVIQSINGQGVSGWFDFDQDGDVDLLSPHEGDQNVLFQNNGDGTFDNITTSRKPPTGLPFINIGNAHGACLGDIDNDGDIDVYLPHSDQANRLILNNFADKGEVSFTDVTLKSGTGDKGGARGCTMADFDNDGYQDIYISNGGLADTLINDVIAGFPPFVQFYIAWDPAENVLLRNNGDGTFTDVTEGSGSKVMGIGKGVASGDLNDDGFPDIVTLNQTYYSMGKRVNIEQSDALLINQGNDNNWVKLKLVGTKSNRSAIQARVKAVAGDLTQMKEIYSANGYNSQDELPIIFGIGKRDKIDSLEITWPSGQVQNFENIEVKQTITITEPN